MSRRRVVKKKRRAPPFAGRRFPLRCLEKKREQKFGVKDGRVVGNIWGGGKGKAKEGSEGRALLPREKEKKKSGSRANHCLL